MFKWIIIISSLIFGTSYGSLHCIIHMDINRTIIASDSAQNLHLDDIVNLSLAKKYVDSWEEGLDPMSYYDYIYTVQCPGPRKDRALRKKRRAIIKEFIHFLDETNHPFYEDALASLHKAKKIMPKQIIFPSFFKLIERLEEKNISYSMIFRTFGSDFDTIAKELGLNIPKASFTQGKLHTEDSIIETPEEIFAYIKKHKWLGIQDDFFYWNNHNERKEYGKQFPLTMSSDTLSIFFDDNIERSADTNIVAPFDVQKKKPLPILPLIRKGILVPVTTIDALLDEDYFIKAISKQLESFPN